MQHVTGKLCFVFCMKCSEQTAIGDGATQFRRSPGMADLDGEPFKAYYCLECSNVARRPMNPFKCLYCGEVYEYGDPNHNHN